MDSLNNIFINCSRRTLFFIKISWGMVKAFSFKKEKLQNRKILIVLRNSKQEREFLTPWKEKTNKEKLREE